MPYYGAGSRAQCAIVLKEQTGTNDSSFASPIPVNMLSPEFRSFARTDGTDIVAFNSSGIPIDRKLQRFSKVGPTGWIWITTGRSTSRQMIYLECGSGNSISDSSTVFTGQGILRFPDLSVAAGAFTDMCGLGNLNDIGTLTRGDYTQPGGFPGISGFSSSKYGEVADADDLSRTTGYPNDRSQSILCWAKASSWPSVGSLIVKSDGLYASEGALYTVSSTELRHISHDGNLNNYCGRSGNPSITTNTWYQFCGTYSGGKTSGSHKVYRNDTQIDTTNVQTTYVAANNTTGKLHFGSFAGTGTYSYPFTNGVLSNGMIFSTDLSATTGLISSWYNWLNSPAGQIISVTDTTPTSGYPYPPIQLLMDCCAL
jgi:hypothetical protein